MRPGRDDIAAPDLPSGLSWVGPEPESMAALTAGGPALVHFIDFSQLNSVRTLPYLSEWAGRYRGAGLSVIGVQAPRFPFGADLEVVSAGLEDLGIEFPLVIDEEHELWSAYGCEGWPSLFLWGLGGALRWVHFGEGEYEATERAIQEELRELDALRELPPPLAPLRPSDAPGAHVVAPSAEFFPGGSWEQPWVAGEDGEELAIEYVGAGAFATVEGIGDLALELDGRPLEPLSGASTGLIALAEHDRHGTHRLVIAPSPGLRIWSLSFAAGLP